VKGVPFAIAIGTIVLLAYFERYLGEPFNRPALMLVAFLLGGGVLGLAFLNLSGSASEILRASALFPLSAARRYAFLLRSVLTDPNLIALLGASAISILILAFARPAVLLWAIASLAALTMSLVAPLCALMLWFRRRATPFAALGWGMAITATAMLAGTLLFSIPSLLEAFLPVRWAANALLSAAAGEWMRATLQLLPLAAVTLGSAALARRLP
jgi:hypothetical protein